MNKLETLKEYNKQLLLENESFRTNPEHQFQAVHQDLVIELNVPDGGSVIEAVEAIQKENKELRKSLAEITESYKNWLDKSYETDDDVDFARTLAIKFYGGQTDYKDTYIYYLDSVVESLMQESDSRLYVIGYLHDILEDTKCTEELLYQLFDKDIVDAVVALTLREDDNIKDYISRVKANPLALIVKKHDGFYREYGIW